MENGQIWYCLISQCFHHGWAQPLHLPYLPQVQIRLPLVGVKLFSPEKEKKHFSLSVKRPSFFSAAEEAHIVKHCIFLCFWFCRCCCCHYCCCCCCCFWDSVVVAAAAPLAHVVFAVFADVIVLPESGVVPLVLCSFLLFLAPPPLGVLQDRFPLAGSKPEAGERVQALQMEQGVGHQVLVADKVIAEDN